MDRKSSLLRASLVIYLLGIVVTSHGQDREGILSSVKEGLQDIKSIPDKIMGTASKFSPLKVDAPGVNDAVNNLTWTQKTLAKLQSAQLANQLKTLRDNYNSTRQLVSNGMAIYNTGRDALQFAKMLSGDVSQMTDLKSWQAMFSRMTNQELNRVMSNNNRLINFSQVYQNRFRRYLSSEGAIDIFAVARQYSDNPTLSYTVILRDMSAGTQQMLSEQCAVYLRDAEALERVAAMADIEANRIRIFLYGQTQEGLTRLEDALSKLDQATDGVDLQSEDGRNSYNKTVRDLNSGMAKFMGKLSGEIGNIERLKVKRELESIREGERLPATAIDQMSRQADEKEQYAIKMREIASKKRAYFNTNCGINELFQTATLNAFYHSYSNGNGENRAGLK